MGGECCGKSTVPALALVLVVLVVLVSHNMLKKQTNDHVGCYACGGCKRPTQIKYASKDGTLIPMFIISRKDAVLNGSNPTILYGYGGFNISMMPAFAASRLLWVQNFGGIYAIANLVRLSVCCV